MSAPAIPLRIDVGADQSVSALLQVPDAMHGCYVMAHGAGAGMSHPFMAAIADGLALRGVATLRYQFLFSERGGKRPDAPAVAQRVVRAAVAHASRELPNVTLIAGGKSFGGRMTSQAQAEMPLPNVAALAFLGFPLHAPGTISEARAAHLRAVHVPMLFLQGTRDSLAHWPLLQSVVGKLGPRATLKAFIDADHSFHVPARSGQTDAQILLQLIDCVVTWMGTLAAPAGNTTDAARDGEARRGAR